MLSLIAALAASTAVQEPPVFHARVETVYLDVFVTRDGAPVEGLSETHFEVRDEGDRQRIEIVPAGSLPLRTLLVFDTSRSLGSYKLERLRDAARHFVALLREDDPVEVVAFDQELRHAPVRAPADLEGSVAASPWGGTALHDALFVALLHAGPERSVVIAFTDGRDNMSWLGEDAVLEHVRRSSAVLHGVAIVPPALADRPERRELRFLRRAAELTGGRLWIASEAAELRTTFGSILHAMRHRYLLRFEPSRPRPGWHRLRVRLRGAKGRVETRPGYWLVP